MDDHRPDLTIPDLLSIRADAIPDRIAFLVDGAHSLTFADWELRSNSVARGLLDRQVRSGDRIGLYFREQDWIDFAVACCAVQKPSGVAANLTFGELPPEPRDGPPRYVLSAFPIGSNAGQMTLYAALTRSPVRAVPTQWSTVLSRRCCR